MSVNKAGWWKQPSADGEPSAFPLSTDLVLDSLIGCLRFCFEHFISSWMPVRFLKIGLNSGFFG